jgi:ssDNA-binding Zn-finger/Zn-ribbon topoisomerase 1
VDLRGRMHEKIALIDRRIAWHGSLSILSHSSTSELMVRSHGGCACQQLADLFCLPHRKGDERWKPSDPENPPCDECSAPTVLLNGRFGLYFECPRCGAKIDLRRRAAQGEPQMASHPEGAAEAGSSTEITGLCPRPSCNGRLKRKSGRYGLFIGCSNYPTCNWTSKT